MYPRHPCLSTTLYHALKGIDAVNADLAIARAERNQEMVAFLQEAADHYGRIVESAREVIRNHFQNE